MRNLLQLQGSKALKALAVITDLGTATQTINSAGVLGAQVQSIDSATIYPAGRTYLVIGMISAVDSAASTLVTMKLRIAGAAQSTGFMTGTADSGAGTHYAQFAAGIFILAGASLPSTFGVQADAGGGNTLTPPAWALCVVVVPLT